MGRFVAERKTDEPTIVEVNWLDLKADQWEVKEFRCKRAIPPMVMLAMQDMGSVTATIDKLCDAWEMILIPADAEHMSKLLTSPNEWAPDQEGLMDAFRYAMNELGMDTEADDPSQPPTSGGGRDDTDDSSSADAASQESMLTI